MGVRRTELPVDGNFTIVPNAWLRDPRLSRRARGLLGEIMTHRVGWHVTVSSLQKVGPEGRDSISTALKELRAAGYLTLLQSRGDHGRWNEVEYELTDPSTATGYSVSGGFTGSGSTASGSAGSGESGTKNTREQEDHLSEDEISSSAASGADQQGQKQWPDDVVRLSQLLAELMVANGHKRPTVGQLWFQAADRMLRLDRRPVAEAEAVLRWSQADEFWQGNILSMSKLREKYDMLRARRNRDQRESGTDHTAGLRDVTAETQAEQQRAWLEAEGLTAAEYQRMQAAGVTGDEYRAHRHDDEWRAQFKEAAHG